MSLTLKFENEGDWDSFKKQRKEDLTKLFTTVENRELVNFILDNNISNLKFCTARRVGKTYMILARMLYDLIFLPWYNGACIRKYQQQVKSNLLKPMLSISEDFVKEGIIKRFERDRIVSDYNTIYYDKRRIVFLSIENPNNSLGIQASNGGTAKFTPLFQTIFVDELIQAQDKYTISVEDSLENLDTIRGSLLRGIKTPYGNELQEFWSFNPWDNNNIIYQKDIERILKVGSHYIEPRTEKMVLENHKELLTGKGEIFQYDEESDTLVYRASHLLIPKSRYSDKLKRREKKMKEENFEKWLCEFGGIHANYQNDIATYLNNMDKKPTFYDPKKHGEIINISIGLDRGQLDDTAFSLCGIAQNDNGNYSLVVIDTKVFYGKTGETKIRNIFNNLQFLKDWKNKWETVRPITIFCDGAAKEFNQLFEDVLYEDPFFRKHFCIENALKTKTKNNINDWDINNRQDFFNKLFSQRKFFFHKDMEPKKIEELWLHFTNCVNDDKGKRNEKRNVNELDIINSLEYAISYENKEAFNLD